MPNTILDKAIAAVPKFGNRIELFTKKLHLAQYADNSIYDYRLKIAQAVLFFNKLPVGVWHHLNGCEKSDFLFPVHGMSYKFYGRFMKLLTRRLKEENYIIADYIR